MRLARQQDEESADTRWLPGSKACDLGIPPGLAELMTVTGSLTRQLRDLCGNAFRLRLLGEHDEAGFGLVREVLMSYGDLPWVFAQTVVPHSTLKANSWITELGERPLGDTLFDRPGVVRSDLFVANLKPGHRLYDHAIAAANLRTHKESLWARRSLIRFVDSELTINEIFLPGAGQQTA